MIRGVRTVDVVRCGSTEAWGRATNGPHSGGWADKSGQLPQQGDGRVKRSGISHATLMLLVCALPLYIFFALALAGVQLNSLWVPVS